MIHIDLNGDFPLINKVNYLNTASIGLIPQPVIQKVVDFISEVSIGGTKKINEIIEENIYNELRRATSKLLNCDPNDVAIFTSVTEAINSIAWSLGITSGKIISTTIEFPSVTYPWIRLSREKNRSIIVKLIDTENYYINQDKIISEIDENTKVVMLSHVEYLTGQINDIRRIADEAHKVGAIVIVDGIQAAGYIPIDIMKLRADIYIIGSYKWLIGPFGAASAYISREIYENIEPAIVGWRSTENMWNFNGTTLKYASTARKFEFCTTAYYSMIGMAESIKYLLNLGIKNIYDHNMQLIRVAAEELIKKNVKITPPYNLDERGSIITFKVKNLENTVNKLKSLERPIEFSVRGGMIRISPHIYNSSNDITQLLENI